MVPKAPVGTAGYELADGGGWRMPWCRRVRIVGGRRSWGWVLCRSGRRISGGLVWMKTMLSLQEGECHVGPNFGGSRGTSWKLGANWRRRRVAEWGRHRKGICGALDPCRHRGILPTSGGVWRLCGGFEERLLSSLCWW